jgi:hypothetical protein
MKKVIGIIILGLLLSSNAYGKDISLKCINTKNSPISITVNEANNKIIFNGYQVRTPISWGNVVYFKNPDPGVFNSKFPNSNDEVQLNRITGELITPTSSADFDHIFPPKFQCSKAKALF